MPETSMDPELKPCPFCRSGLAMYLTREDKTQGVTW